MRSIIVCPVCGREYLPEEIFLKSEMYGNPKAIVRDDEDKKIIRYSGDSVNLYETYQCDKCDTLLRVTGRLNFMTDIISKKEDFSEEYVSKFKKVSLAED